MALSPKSNSFNPVHAMVDAGKASSALDTAENRSRNAQLERSSSMRVSLLRSKMISRNSVHSVNSAGKLRRRFLVKSMRYTGWPAALAAWALSMLVYTGAACQSTD